MKSWEKLLKSALQSVEAVKFINNQNDCEPKRKENNPLRPVLLWTQRVAFTVPQRATLEKMCGLGSFKGHNLGWTILAPVWSFEEQVYAVVCRSVDGTYGVVYPNGELEKHGKPTTSSVVTAVSIRFRAIGDWTLDMNVNRRVAKAPPSERTGFIPLEEREPDQFEASHVRISGLYDKWRFRVD